MFLLLKGEYNVWSPHRIHRAQVIPVGKRLDQAVHCRQRAGRVLSTTRWPGSLSATLWEWCGWGDRAQPPTLWTGRDNWQCWTANTRGSSGAGRLKAVERCSSHCAPVTALQSAVCWRWWEVDGAWEHEEDLVTERWGRRRRALATKERESFLSCRFMASS